MLIQTTQLAISLRRILSVHVLNFLGKAIWNTDVDLFTKMHSIFFIAESLALYVVLHKSSEKSEVCINHAACYAMFLGYLKLWECYSFIIQIYWVQKALERVYTLAQKTVLYWRMLIQEHIRNVLDDDNLSYQNFG